MDNQKKDLSSTSKTSLNPYQKGAEKALAQAGEAHVSEAVQSGVPIQDILAQLQALSQTPVPAQNTGGGMMSGMQGIVPAILQAVQGQGFNPMAPKQETLGMDNAAKLMALQQTMGKNQMDAQKFPMEMQKLQGDISQQPLQQKKLETEVEQMQPEAKIAQAKAEAQAKGGFLTANDLFTKFESSVQPFIVQRDAYSRIKESVKNPSPAGDLALIYGYMKLLDPGSTVREGEFATAQNSGSVPQRIQAMYNKVASGKRLAPEQREDFLSRSKSIYSSAEAQYGKTRKEFVKLSIANKLDPESLIRDLGIEEVAGTEQAQATTQVAIPTRSKAPKGATGWDTEKGDWVY